jgi:hypothetical protein
MPPGVAKRSMGFAPVAKRLHMTWPSRCSLFLLECSAWTLRSSPLRLADGDQILGSVRASRMAVRLLCAHCS